VFKPAVSVLLQENTVSFSANFCFSLEYIGKRSRKVIRVSHKVYYGVLIAKKRRAFRNAGRRNLPTLTRGSG
jgi:hypothetical protein